MLAEVYLGLGSNLDNPAQQLRTAVMQLRQLPQTRYLKDSGLFTSKPMGPQDQPDYLNAVAMLETTLPARELLQQLLAIETRMGRVRERHWGPRCIDLDILLYGMLELDAADLQIPHPGLAERAFVLYPLARVNPNVQIPARGKLETLLQQCPENGLRYVGEIA